MGGTAAALPWEGHASSRPFVALARQDASTYDGGSVTCTAQRIALLKPRLDLSIFLKKTLFIPIFFIYTIHHSHKIRFSVKATIFFKSYSSFSDNLNTTAAASISIVYFACGAIRGC